MSFLCWTFFSPPAQHANGWRVEVVEGWRRYTSSASLRHPPTYFEAQHVVTKMDTKMEAQQKS
jgi:hypothetical protein